jgi:rubrerythrin
MIVKDYKPLRRLIQQAYSAEKAAAFAYQGHANSLKDAGIKACVQQIESDEWHHRAMMLELMAKYGFRPSMWLEIRFALVGKLISSACFIIGRFMPIYFAGRLESGNVCEYFRMIHLFHDLGIREHDQLLYDLGVKEKEHEVYFYDCVKDDPWLPFFEKHFHWGQSNSMNDLELENLRSVIESDAYCKK